MCWPKVYGAYFFPSLGFRGCSPPQLERRYWVGLGLVWERKGRKCGFQLSCAFFGLSGRIEIVGCLKTRSIRFVDVNCFSFVIYGRGTKGFFGSGPPSVVDFVDWLGHSQGFLFALFCILHVYFGVLPCASFLLIYCSLFIKQKKIYHPG